MSDFEIALVTNDSNPAVSYGGWGSCRYLNKAHEAQFLKKRAWILWLWGSLSRRYRSMHSFHGTCCFIRWKWEAVGINLSFPRERRKKGLGEKSMLLLLPLKLVNQSTPLQGSPYSVLFYLQYERIKIFSWVYSICVIWSSKAWEKDFTFSTKKIKIW